MDDEKIAKRDKLLFGTGILIAVLVICASAYLYSRYIQIKRIEISDERVVSATPVLQAVQSDYKNLKIEILNASGKSGVAGIFTKKLLDLGYSNVTAGNYGSVLNGGILKMPEASASSFESDLKSLGFSNYKIEKSDSIQIILGK
jgi:hypothetical protein